jgi:hypothetical protein
MDVILALNDSVEKHNKLATPTVEIMYSSGGILHHRREVLV